MGSLPVYHSATYNLTSDSLRHDYDADTTPATGKGHGLNTQPDLLGIGCDYMNGINQTQNYVNQDYELKIDSAINSGNAFQPTFRNNKIVIQESFLNNFAQMNLQTLVKNQ